jgi:hypothetical protein
VPSQELGQRLWYIELIIQPLKETNTSLRIHSVSHQARPSHKVISAALVYHEHSDTSEMLIEDDTTGRFLPTDLCSTNFGIHGKWKLPMIPILRRLEHSIFMTLGAIFKTVRLLPWPDKMILPLEPTTISMPYRQDGCSLVVRAPACGSPLHSASSASPPNARKMEADVRAQIRAVRFGMSKSRRRRA